jgi:hypothetical protein
MIAIAVAVIILIAVPCLWVLFREPSADERQRAEYWDQWR